VGVLAVDPSSPRSPAAPFWATASAWTNSQAASELYIRSIGSRSTHSTACRTTCPRCWTRWTRTSASTEVLLETVGVGQAEYAARVQVDTLVLVLLPESGDIVQAMKAGIMEMADIFVVNKADLPGAQKMATDVKRIASLNRQERGAWVPAVLLASASQPESIEALSAEIDRHQAWLQTSERRAALLQQRARYRLRRLVEVRTAEVLARQDPGFFEKPLAQQMASVLDQLGQAIRSKTTL
jgi:LAO/AO transport system kinase